MVITVRGGPMIKSELIAKLAEENPHLTQRDIERVVGVVLERMIQALETGARGYILKNANDLNLVSAVRRVAAGEIVLDPQLAPPANLKGEREHGLTERELEILQLIVDGKSNKEIAAQLDLSSNTVSVHRANMMRALGIHNTAELVSYAIRTGLVNIR